MDQDREFPFSKLTKVIQVHVLSFLDLRMLMRCSLASKDLKKASESTLIWKQKYWEWFGDGLLRENEDWKQSFISSFNRPEIDRKKLEIVGLLGHGPFKSVYRGKFSHRGKSSCSVAVAVYNNYYLSTNKKLVEREIDIMKKLKHPNVIRLHGFTTGKDPSPWNISESAGKIEMEGKYSLVLDAMEQNLMDLFANREVRWNKTQICKMAQSVSEALAYLHDREPFPLVCRNLTLTKVFVSSDYSVVKLGGFSEAAYCKKEQGKNLQVEPVDPMAASAVFMAPELLKEGEAAWDELVDVFSFGIFLWCLFPENHAKRIYAFPNAQIVKAVLEGQRPDEPQLIAEQGEQKHFFLCLKQLMLLCWQENPKKRPSALHVSQMIRQYSNM